MKTEYAKIMEPFYLMGTTRLTEQICFKGVF